MIMDLGMVAYLGYCEISCGKSLVSGALLPTWGDLKPEIREAWRAAADAVKMTVETGVPPTEPKPETEARGD